MAKVSAAVSYEAIGARGAALDPDVALMLSLKAGDDSAFTELVHRHQARVISLAYRFVGNEAEAEDLAQEVFLRVYRTRERYEPRARFSTWLYRIAANISLNALRSRARRRAINVPLAFDSDETQEGQASQHVQDHRLAQPGAHIERVEVRDQIRRAVDQLPDSQKVAVVLNKYEGLSYDDIASVMGCSTMAVKSLLARARTNLREKLEYYVETGRIRHPATE
jgi:RNA polymerase sigma-70 factor, ECF subfamily